MSVTATSCSPSSFAQATPANPAPTITTWGSAPSRPSVEDMTVVVALRLTGRLGEGRHVPTREEALVAVAPLHVLGDQHRVRRALGEDLLQVRLVLALAHDVGEELRAELTELTDD